MKKGFIQITILIAIIVGVLVLGGAGYLSVNQYQKFQQEKMVAKLGAQELAKTQQEEEAQTEVERKKQNSEIAKLKGEMRALKDKKPETTTQIIVRETPLVQQSENDLPSIIKYWRPIIAYIECDDPVVDTNGNFQYQETISGSGLAVYVQSLDQYTLWTNKHVISHSAGEACRVILPDNNSPLISIKAHVSSRSDADFAIVYLPKPNEFLQNVIKNHSNTPPFFCSQKPSVGDKIVVLGYPGIGSRTDITATDGIISGYDGNYLITSAKIEQGNSGGAAILVKGNCYLGIPSFSKLGIIESLARILEWHNLFNSL